MHQHLHRDAQWSVWLERWNCLVFLSSSFSLLPTNVNAMGPRESSISLSSLCSSLHCLILFSIFRFPYSFSFLAVVLIFFCLPLSPAYEEGKRKKQNRGNQILPPKIGNRGNRNLHEDHIDQRWLWSVFFYLPFFPLCLLMFLMMFSAFLDGFLFLLLLLSTACLWDTPQKKPTHHSPFYLSSTSLLLLFISRSWSPLFHFSFIRVFYHKPGSTMVMFLSHMPLLSPSREQKYEAINLLFMSLPYSCHISHASRDDREGNGTEKGGKKRFYIFIIDRRVFFFLLVLFLVVLFSSMAGYCVGWPVVFLSREVGSDEME